MDKGGLWDSILQWKEFTNQKSWGTVLIYFNYFPESLSIKSRYIIEGTCTLAEHITLSKNYRNSFILF